MKRRARIVRNLTRRAMLAETVQLIGEQSRAAFDRIIPGASYVDTLVHEAVKREADRLEEAISRTPEGGIFEGDGRLVKWGEHVEPCNGGPQFDKPRTGYDFRLPVFPRP